MRIFEIIVAVISVIIAIYSFDWYDFNRSIVSILVILSAFLLISKNKKFKETIRKTAVLLAVFLVLKLLITG